MMLAWVLASSATKKLPGANWRRFTKSTDLIVGSRRGIPHQQVKHHRHAAKDRDALGLEQPKRRTPLGLVIVPESSARHPRSTEGGQSPPSYRSAPNAADISACRSRYSSSW